MTRLLTGSWVPAVPRLTQPLHHHTIRLRSPSDTRSEHPKRPSDAYLLIFCKTVTKARLRTRAHPPPAPDTHCGAAGSSPSSRTCPAPRRASRAPCGSSSATASPCRPAPGPAARPRPTARMPGTGTAASPQPGAAPAALPQGPPVGA